MKIFFFRFICITLLWALHIAIKQQFFNIFFTFDNAYLFSPARPISFFCLSVCLSVCQCLSVCVDDYSKTRAWIWMKCCVSIDVGTWTNWLNFEPDPDHSPDPGIGFFPPISYMLCKFAALL